MSDGFQIHINPNNHYKYNGFATVDFSRNATQEFSLIPKRNSNNSDQYTTFYSHKKGIFALTSLGSGC